MIFSFVKNVLLYIAFFLISHSIFAQYITHEDAFDSSSDAACECITITPDDSYKSGSFWNESLLDLSQSFEIIVKPNFGCTTESSDGGDGIAFLLQTNGTGQLPTGDGGNLGYNGISPSLVVQFDTYRDNPILYPDNNDPGGDFFPYYDHVGLMTNGSCNHETPEDLSTEPFSPTFTDVEDCVLYSDHQITFLWDVTTQQFQVIYCNDIEGCFTVVDQTIDITNTIFSGNGLVNWGFTGSTGGAKNEQGVCIQYFDRQPTVTDTVVCYQENLVIDLTCMNNFSFEWKDLSGNIVSTSPVFDIIPLVNNDYELTITNEYTGRTFSEFFSVTVLQPILEEVLSAHIDNDCFGYSDGQLALNFINAVGEVNYSLDGTITQIDSIFTNLLANDYELTAQDEYGCRDTLDIVIAEEPELILNIDNIQGVVCNTVNTGSIEVTPTGGVGGYTLSWVDGNSITYNQEDLFAISDGFYDYTLEDANSCTLLGQIFVDQINSIDMDTLSLIQIDCFQENTGEISISPTGGLAPFSFDWTGPNGFVDNQNTISNLSAGDYSLTLTDFENCYRIYPFVLEEGSEVLVDVLSTTDAKCSYSADGIVEVAHSGGDNSTFAVVLDNALNLVSNLDITNTLNAGNYFVYAEDNLGCISTSTPFSIGAPSDIIVTPLDLDDVECFGDDDGKVQISIAGGTLPYNGFSWSGPNGYTNSAQNIYSLYSGNYTVTATDANGCVKTENFFVDEGSVISVGAAAIEYVKCKGDNSGAITPLITGGTPPYGNYSWTNQDGFTATSLAINNLFVGEYTFTVEDSYECEKEYTFNIFEPDSLLQFTVSTLPSCLIEPTGQASIDIIGGVKPYTIDWFGANPLAIPAGNNYVQVTDDANCLIADSFLVNLLPQPTADFTVDSVIKLNTDVRLLNNSSSEISWDWDFGNQTFSTLETPQAYFGQEGDYRITLEVLNVEGCSDTISKPVTVSNGLMLFVPNSFTPNGDLKNDIFIVSAQNFSTFELNIYNLYGTNLFSTTDPSIGWDGTFNGKEVQKGNYVVTIFAVDIFGRVYNRNKNIILIK